MRYLVRFRGGEPIQFALAELEACATCAGVPITILGHIDSSGSSLPPLLYYVDIPSDEDVEMICERSVMIRYVCRVIAEANSWEELSQSVVDQYSAEYFSFLDGSSFAGSVDFPNGTVPWSEQTHVYHLMNAWPTCGTVDLKHPEHLFMMIRVALPTPQDVRYTPYGPMTSRSYLASRVIGQGGMQDAASKYSLKKRTYLGTTSMDAQLSAIMASLALCTEECLVCDPFAGTGSVGVAMASYGSQCVLFDGDREVMNRVDENFRQYGFEHLLVSRVRQDIRNPAVSSQSGPWFDAIVTDPPYGLRVSVYHNQNPEEAAAVGAWVTRGNPSAVKVSPDGTQSFATPTTVKEGHNDFSPVLCELLAFAAKSLIVGGRLVYWLVTTEHYSDREMLIHPCFRIIHNLDVLLYGPYRRRLIVAVKVRSELEAKSHVRSLLLDNGIHESQIQDDCLLQVHNWNPADPVLSSGGFVDSRVISQTRIDMDYLSACRDTRMAKRQQRVVAREANDRYKRSKAETAEEHSTVKCGQDGAKT